MDPGSKQRSSGKRLKRNQSGSILALFILSFSLLLVTCMLPILTAAQTYILQTRQSKALEAASLAAAKDLIRVTVDDPYFGYISLVDQPPIGKSTKAADGVPLPVTGINTLWATCRQELLLANQLDSEDLREFSRHEIVEATRATALLSKALDLAISPNCPSSLTDANGEQLQIYNDALQAFRRNAGQLSFDATEEEHLKLKLGWLDDNCDSGMKYPRPARLAELKEDSSVCGNYKACRNIPVKLQPFYFAALGKQAAISDVRLFRDPDGKRLCSVVLAEANLCSHASKKSSFNPVFNVPLIHCSACAVPEARPDTTLPGILRISFGGKLMPEISCLADLVSSQALQKWSVNSYTVAGGDYPNNCKSSLKVADQNDGKQPFTRIAARGIFDWLRTAHAKPRLDSLYQIFKSSFSDQLSSKSGSASMPSLRYQFDRKGCAMITQETHTPFLNEIVPENQHYILANNLATSSGSVSLSSRNLVENLGKTSGGPHGGQPLLGDPLNWSELPYYAGDTNSAEQKGEGQKASGLIAMGDTPEGLRAPGAISLASANFESEGSGKLDVQPRKNYYASGLAVEFRFATIE